MFHAVTRAGCLAGALVAAGVASQYPAFTQQYTQRLGGQVDALTQVVADFDSSALAAGLTRGEALAEMTGTPFIVARADDMRATFARHAILADQLTRLRNANPVERIWLAPTLRDAPTLRATWADFSPALPMTLAGALTAGIGAIAGWFAMATVFGALKLPFRRRARKPHRHATQPRVDPPVQRPEITSYTATPRLMGDTRP